MTARARTKAPRLAPALTLELLPPPPPPAPAPVVEEPAPGRPFAANLEVIWLDADTYVERETCPELEPLDLPGPVYRSRGVVRLGGNPRVRFDAAMSRRVPIGLNFTGAA